MILRRLACERGAARARGWGGATGPSLGAALLALACACSGGAAALRSPAAAPAANVTPPVAGAVAGATSTVRSNILRTDYAGSAACEACHPALYAEWMRTPMHRMTRPGDAPDAAAPFDGARFAFQDDAARMESVDGRRYVRVESGRFGAHLYRVTKIIGGHHREDFAGREVASTAPDAPLLGDPRDERVLPVSWAIGAAAWRYKGYSVMVGERPGLRVGGVWNRTCVFCHNTVPLLSTLLGPLAGDGAPAYQGEVVDPLLPAARRARYVVRDPAGLARALADETRLLGGSPTGDPLRALRVTRARFDERHLVELGIGCESCHGGSAEHVADPRLHPSLAVRSPLVEVVPPAGADTRAATVNRVCARCHQVLFSRYPATWEGGLRAAAPGGSHINSGEARDLLLGGCASAMSCVDCHDPHRADRRAELARLEGREGDRVCLRCHGRYAGDEALAAHSHHRPDGPGARCIACHMPKKNMGLDHRLTRYHRVGSPTDRARVEGDRPLECALCHEGASVASLLGAMERFWGRRYDRTRLTALYGPDLDVPVATATLARGRPHEQAVALELLGRAGARAAAQAALPSLAGGLLNPIPIVRYYAVAALEAITGRRAPVDVNAPAAKIAAAARAWIPSLAGVPASGGAAAQEGAGGDAESP